MNYEADHIEIGGNVFIGGGAAIAFVTSQHGFVHHNAIIYPSRYVIRILQESNNPKFLPCGTGVFMNNIVVVNQRLRRLLNIGPGTSPSSFMFAENLWYDISGRRIPKLPLLERNPVYYVNPGLSFKSGSVQFTSRDLRMLGKGPAYYRRRVAGEQ
jgi:hypothetical protein